MNSWRAHVVRPFFVCCCLWIFSTAHTLGQESSPISNSIGIRMVLIPAGTFTMGAKDNEGSTPRNATPQHEVTLTHSFYMGVFEVTNEQYNRVMGTKSLRGENAKVDNLPADTMSWEQAVQFCEKLSELPEEKAAGRTYRLPNSWRLAMPAPMFTCMISQ